MTIIDMSSVEKAGQDSPAARRKGRGKSSPGHPDLFAGLVREHGSRSTAKSTNHQARTAIAEGHHKNGADPSASESKAEKKQDKQPSASDAAVAALLSQPQARSRVLADRTPASSDKAQSHAAPSSRVAASVPGPQLSPQPDPLVTTDPSPKAPQKTAERGSQSATATRSSRRGDEATEGTTRGSSEEASPRRVRSSEPGPRRGDEAVETHRPVGTPASASPASTRGRESSASPFSYPSLQVQAQVLSASGPTPASVSPAAPSVVMQASLLIERAAADRRPNAEIVLHPESLGRIQVQLQWDASGSLSATVVAQSDSTAQLLAASAQDLHDSLSSAGLDISGLDVRADARSAAEKQAALPASPGRSTRVSLTAADDIALTGETLRLGLIRGGSNLDLLA